MCVVESNKKTLPSSFDLGVEQTQINIPNIEEEFKLK